MSDYTPTTEEVVRGYTLPGHVTQPRRDGESLGEWMSRISMETHIDQLASEAAARRWLTAHDAEVAAKAWDEGYRRGNAYALDEPWDNRNHISRNPYRQDGDQP